MARFGLARTASIFITLFGCIANAILTAQIAAAWRSFTVKGEQESEWEALSDKWDSNGLRFVWGLLFVYFASSTTVSAVGLYGVLKAKASHVRFYRDFSIADFAFCTVSALFAIYAALVGRARASLCEELSHHPELMREMLEMGLNLENCEIWLERAVFAIVAIMSVVTLVRLHFLFAVSSYYSQLIRPYSCHHHHYHLPQRILLVPTSHNRHVNDIEQGAGEMEMVYAPVPKSSLPKELQDQATDAWVTTTSSSHAHHHQFRHHRHSRYHRRSSTGRIRLNIVPDEGLFPPNDCLDRR